MIGIAAAAAAIVLAVKSQVPDRPSEAVAQTPSLLPDRGARTARSSSPSIRNPPTTKDAINTVAYKTKFAQSSNYWAFVQDVASAALAGDADAQYYTWKALSYCDEKNRLYFIRRGQRLSMENGLAWAVERQLPYDVAQAAYDRCHDFLDHSTATDEGSALQWLTSAAKAGQPAARSSLAAKIIEQDMQRGFEAASGVSDPKQRQVLDRSVPPRELLRQAVKSGDPEALFTVSEMIPILKPKNQGAQVDRFAWMLVACERGFDCSPRAEWVAVGCQTATCGSTSEPGDVVRILAGDEWSAVQNRAQEINESLDAGRWEDLGFDQ